MKEPSAGVFCQKIPFLPNILSHRVWLIGFWRDGVFGAPDVVIPGKGADAAPDVQRRTGQLAVTWRTFPGSATAGAVRSSSRGVYGDDARRAVDEGAAAISVRITAAGNSTVFRPRASLAGGGRSVNGQVEILMDGGIRRGTDIVKRCAWGSRGSLRSRPTPTGLTASGEPDRASHRESCEPILDRTLRLLGCSSLPLWIART